MNKELTDRLNKNYPEIFAEGMYFECADGWYELIDSLCDEITQFCNKYNQTPPVASQVKEKFGSLRFYVWTAPTEVYDIISKYELQSQYFCEVCGESGKIHRIGGWYSCYCDTHLAEHYKRREEAWTKK